jgi:hypothetical protein
MHPNSKLCIHNAGLDMPVNVSAIFLWLVKQIEALHLSSLPHIATKTHLQKDSGPFEFCFSSDSFTSLSH